MSEIIVPILKEETVKRFEELERRLDDLIKRIDERFAYLEQEVHRLGSGEGEVEEEKYWRHLYRINPPFDKMSGSRLSTSERQPDGHIREYGYTLEIYDDGKTEPKMRLKRVF